MIELRHLRYFIAVAEELSFRRAAERVHIDQSPLSRTIHDLESDLGVLLFAQTPCTRRLTPAGEILLQEVHELFVRRKPLMVACVLSELHEIVEAGFAHSRSNFLATQPEACTMQCAAVPSSMRRSRAGRSNARCGSSAATQHNPRHCISETGATLQALGRLAPGAPPPGGVVRIDIAARVALN